MTISCRHLLLSGLLALCSVLLHVVPIAAQAPDETLQAAVRAYESGELESARALFERLHAQQPTARTLRGLGMVAFRQERFGDAALLLEASLSSQEKPLTQELAQGVQTVLAAARAHLGRVVLTGLMAEASVLVDGAPATRDAQGALLLSSGAHSIAIFSAGHLPRSYELSVPPGAQVALDAELQASPELVSTRAAPNPSTAPIAAATSASSRARQAVRTEARLRRLRRTSYSLMAVAAGGLATSLVATALGIARVHDIEDYCRAHGLCEESEARTRAHDQNLQLLSVLSIGGLVVGGMSGAGGLVIWLTAPRMERGPQPQRGLMLGMKRAF